MISAREDGDLSPGRASRFDQDAVLFVDDESAILSAIRRLIRPLGVQAYFAQSGEEGLDVLAKHHIDLVVSDMRMPNMSGAEFLAKVKTAWPETVRMLLTGYADMGSTIEALNNGGIYRYIAKPWNDGELKSIILDGLKLRRLEREKLELQALTRQQNDELTALNLSLEAKVEQRTEQIREASAQLEKSHVTLVRSYDAFVRVFSSFITSREALRKSNHSVIADFSRQIARQLKLREGQVRSVYYAGLLHDLGKVSMPDGLLRKPIETMNDEERALYQLYPIRSEVALAGIPGLDPTAAIIRAHAEYFDGSGFPGKISGEEIPLGARILRAAADFIELQVNAKTVKPMRPEDAIRFMKAQLRARYDPNILDVIQSLSANFTLSVDVSGEIAVHSHALTPGMELTRDIHNLKGLLLIAKGLVLTQPMIEKLFSVELLDNRKPQYYVKGAVSKK